MAVVPPPQLPQKPAPEGSHCETIHPAQLRAVPIFGGLSEAAADKLCSCLLPQDWGTGAQIFNAGEPGDSMYFIDRGRVRIKVTDADGQEVTLADLGHGEFFGEMALVDGQARSATATALEETRLARLTREDFLTFIGSDQKVMLGMLAAMAARLRHTDNLLRHRVSRNANTEQAAHSTMADRAADLIATFGGSWKFIGFAILLFLLWMGLNTLMLRDRAFDAYPYIFLNLVLAMITGLQAPIIMMSQNRQSRKDRLRADLDYELNLKNELVLTEIRNMLAEQLEKDRAKRSAAVRHGVQ